MNKRLLKVIVAILRQVLLPYDVYERTPQGDPLYKQVASMQTFSQVGGLTQTPITVPVVLRWASIVAKVLNLIVVLLAAWQAGEMFDLNEVYQMIREIFTT